jgi:UDP-N-acetylmuramoyl-L-alanyl-D-glutamate--2,6-diaminopimelate ligase
VKTIASLISTINTINILGSTKGVVTGLVLDSRKIEEGSMFFALKGALLDGHQYIDSAIAKGAVAIVCETLPSDVKDGICYIQVQKVNDVVGLIAANYYDYPSKDLKVVGVTGTNGKTTIATLLYQLFTELGYKVGLISTVANYIGDKMVPATHTTPDPISLQHLFNEMYENDCTHVFMEVSSHAVDQRRIAGVEFDGALFTNLTHDHLDYHKTFDAYLKAKKRFFDDLDKKAFAIVNADDKRGMVMLQNTKAQKLTYALKIPADFKGKILENELDGLKMLIDQKEVNFRLIGTFNAYNLLAVYGAAICLGEDKNKVLEVLSKLKGAAGRFETLRSAKDNLLGIVDYAHTPDALLNVLATIKQFSNEKQIITVVGCGGDRDKTKRPEMAEVAVTHSTKVIFTSDNPRTEDPEAILDDMEKGVAITLKKKCLRISNRGEAIKAAVAMADKESIILLAGKGHETYQEINGVKNHFDDKEQLQNMFTLLER